MSAAVLLASLMLYSTVPHAVALGVKVVIGGVSYGAALWLLFRARVVTLADGRAFRVATDAAIDIDGDFRTLAEVAAAVSGGIDVRAEADLEPLTDGVREATSAKFESDPVDGPGDDDGDDDNSGPGHGDDDGDEGNSGPGHGDDGGDDDNSGPGGGHGGDDDNSGLGGGS